MRSWVTTDQRHEAALLLTMGFPLLQAARVKGEQRDRELYHFAPQSATGSHRAEELLATWRAGAEKMAKTRPADVITWMRAYAENAEYLRRTAESATELVSLSTLRGSAILNPNDPQVVQDEYLRRLGV